MQVLYGYGHNEEEGRHSHGEEHENYANDPHFTKYTRQSSEFALNIKSKYEKSAE